MAFNFKQYTSNNPLLQPINEDGDNVTAADNAAYGADQEIGDPLEEDDDYISDEEFDLMSDDELDAAGLTGDEPLGPNEEFEARRQNLTGEEISNMARIGGVKIKDSVKALMNAGYEKDEIVEFISLLMKTI